MTARGTLRRRRLRRKFLRRTRSRRFFLDSDHGRFVIDTLEEATGAGFKDAMTAVYPRLGAVLFCYQAMEARGIREPTEG